MWLPPCSSVRNRKALKRVSIGIVVALGAVIAFVIHEWPRWVLRADARQAKTIIASWDVRDENDVVHEYAYVLEGAIKEEFVTVLNDKVGVDYTRSVATIPTVIIRIYLLDVNGRFRACYAIRHAQGGTLLSEHGKRFGGRSPAMESLYDIASRGRRFSGTEMAEFFARPYPRKWPGLGRFDYTLPVVPAGGQQGVLPPLPPSTPKPEE